MFKHKIKTIETMSFIVQTTATDIVNGKCGLTASCMEKIAIERSLRKRDPRGGDHKVRIDGGLIKFTLQGFKWHAITPKVAKRSLIQFDKERKPRELAEKNKQIFKSKVQPHNYRVEAVKGEKIKPLTRERMDQINNARQRRKDEGRPDKQRYDLRYRVEGLGSV